MFATGRVQVVGSFVDNVWVTGGILYGYPQGKTHPRALERTNGFLDHLVDHMLHHASGPRYLCGDWNFETSQLPSTQKLLQHGWQEVQQIEFLRHGVKPKVTCKHTTQKDFLWISPELIASYQGLVVDQETFPDHACLLASFACGRQYSKRYLWPTPSAVPWQLVDLPSQTLDFSTGDPTETYKQMWSQREMAAAAQLPTWKPEMGGRGQRLEPITRTGWPTPPKLGRSTDYQPTFYGYDVQHSRWLKQLRRLHNFANWSRANHQVDSSASRSHGLALWNCILRAPGFSPSFQAWWSCRHFVGLGDPGWIPSFLPDCRLAQLICEVFSCEVRHLEFQLQQNRRGYRRWQHQMDPNSIFRDTKRPPPEPVSTLLESARSCVVEVDPEDMAIVIDPPCQFDETVPVQVGDVAIPIIHATDTKLYLESLDAVAVDNKVCQSKAVGALDDLFLAFREQWQKRWCKHDNLPHSHWNELIGFARHAVPSHPFNYLPITPELLRAEVGRKKKNSATGLDGVTRQDLLTLDFPTLASFCGMFERASSDGAWPKQVVCGRVSSLAKTLQAAEVNQYRPITVFSMAYRCFSSLTARALLDWADDWAHPDVFGNRKGHQTSHLWRTLVTEIQVAHDQGLPLSGVTADIEKCYNCLPRFPILAIALHCGVPFPSVVAWSGALASMERRFKVRESFSGSCKTSTGLAEGCALSCFGMLLLDDVLHRFVHAMNPNIRVLSFVDNWDFLTFDSRASLQQLDLLLDFARLTDLTVDRQKTFAWSTDARVRGSFRAHNIPVKHHARDLGAHVAFSKQRTNRAVTDRLRDLDLLWDRLRRSKAGYRAKLRALRTVAWPRGLFGIASAPVGHSIWLNCRRAATKALAFNKPGVNPLILLGMVESFADPEFVALVKTVTETREQCALDFWASELYPAAVGLLACPPSSPTMVLLERLQLVGIGVCSDGTWEDEIGRFHPWNVGHAELCHRLQWAWQKYVAAQVAHRMDFHGLDNADTACTKLLLESLPPDKQALLRLGLAGGLFTQNAHSHWNGQTNACRWCHLPDSLQHRYFECPQFEDLRRQLAPDAVRLRPSLPNALALRGWAVRPASHIYWCRLLDSIPAEVPGLDCSFKTSGWNHVFTDGSCFWQSSPSFRVAAWGAILAEPLSDSWNFQMKGILGAGPLPGLCQTSYRSELFAIGFALHHAAQGGFRVKIHSDCLGVINKFYLLTQGRKKLKMTSSSADLWQWVLDSVARLGSDRVQVIKIAAHRRLDTARTTLDVWKFWNNGAADKVAKSANLRRHPGFWACWEYHARCVLGATELHRQVAILQVAIAMRSVEADATETLDEAPHLEPTENKEFEVLFDTGQWDGTVPQALALEYGISMAHRLVTWWKERTATVDRRPIHWISFAHLYVDYQLTWGCAGPIRSGKGWLDSTTRPYIEPERSSFLLRVKWFRRSLKFFWQKTGQKVGLAQCRPTGHSISSYVTCASLCWDDSCLAAADRWILEQCKVPCTRGSTALKSLPLANKSGGMRICPNLQREVEGSS